ncbi:MAG: UPF0182 family protein, partial [Pseudomonadota bacterium]
MSSLFVKFRGKVMLRPREEQGGTPQVFYNREDQWQIPKEIYGNESQAVAPYYLIMKLPTAR